MLYVRTFRCTYPAPDSTWVDLLLLYAHEGVREINRHDAANQLMANLFTSTGVALVAVLQGSGAPLLVRTTDQFYHAEAYAPRWFVVPEEDCVLDSAPF